MPTSLTAFLPRLTRDARPRLPSPAASTLWDPFLLDRLHAPLTRHHE